MERFIVGALWDRINRNGTNNNFKYLFESVKVMNDLTKKADETIRQATFVLREAVGVNAENKDVQNQIDQLVIDSGTSDAEVIQARGGFSVLRERLDENEQNFKGVGRNRNMSLGVYNRRSPKGTLVILDDDTRKTSYSILYQYAKENNVPITLAANSGLIENGDGDRITMEQFREMKNDSLVEFVNHTHTHLRLTDLTEEEIHDEIRLCEEFLYSHGIYTKHLVYPFGAVNDTVKQIAHQYVDSASKSNGLNISPSEEVLDSFQLNRIVFEEQIGTFNNRINKAAADGGCVLINSHSQYDTFSISKLDEILTLARNAGLDIVHYSEAFRRFSNAIELRENDGDLIGGVSSDGVASGIFYKEVKFLHPSEISVTSASLPDDYENMKITSFNINNQRKTEGGWPEAGRLFTFRSGPDDFTYQLLHVVNSHVVLKRFWDTGQPGWSDFSVIGGHSKIKSTYGPYNLAVGEFQNITIYDSNVKVGDVISFSIDTIFSSKIIVTGPFVNRNGEIRLRYYNADEFEREIPAHNIYTKVVG